MSYADYSNRGLYLYLRPVENINDYLIEDLAIHISGNGNFVDAKKYLYYLLNNDVQTFKNIYYEYVKINGKMPRQRQYINKTYSIDGAYGEDSHMYYRKTIDL